ncbi:putative plant non-specific lipid-transfer protein/Par allergen [Dioscorea sansibarensis]
MATKGGGGGGGAWYWSFVMAAMVAVVTGDFAADRAECATYLVGLSTCLTFVQGSASAPTPDCCSGLEQVLGKSRKCLCVLIKDRNEPDLGFKINVTRAMSLPDVCHASANISDCPSGCLICLGIQRMLRFLNSLGILLVLMTREMVKASCTLMEV